MRIDECIFSEKSTLFQAPTMLIFNLDVGASQEKKIDSYKHFGSFCKSSVWFMGGEFPKLVFS